MRDFAALWRPVRELSTREASMGIVSCHGHAAGAAHRSVAPARDRGVGSGGGGGGDVVGSGAYRRDRNSRTPEAVGKSGAPTDLPCRAAARYGADGVDSDGIDEAAISVGASISDGPVPAWRVWPTPFAAT
jgi:hypothetical protein